MKRNRICAALLTAVLCLNVSPLQVFCEEEETTVVYDGLIYTQGFGTLYLVGMEDTTAVSVTIPAEVDGIPVSMDSDSFDACPALEEICVEEDNPNYTCKDGILYSKSEKMLYRCPIAKTGDIVIPEGVVDIFEGAFENCAGITSVTLPDSLRVIQVNTFDGCTGLQNFIGELKIEHGSAISSCKSLQEIVLSEEASPDKSERMILYLNATNFSQLERVVIPEALEMRGAFAFRHCPMLTELSLSFFTRAPMNNEVLVIDCDSLETLTVPTMKTGTSGNGSLDIVVSDCEKLATLTIGEGRSDSWTVSNCPSLTKLFVFADGQGESAIENCENLTVYGYADATYLQYQCEQAGIPFVALEDYIPRGDVSADEIVDILDVIRLSQALLGTEALDGWGGIAGDYNGDGSINSADCLEIMRYLVKLDTAES